MNPPLHRFSPRANGNYGAISTATAKSSSRDYIGAASEVGMFFAMNKGCEETTPRDRSTEETKR